MILRKLAYHEFDEKPNYWAFKKPFELGKINLLVGKNATGKTNIITKIAWLGGMLAGLQPQLLNSGNYDVEFSDNADTYQYKLNLLNKTVLYEELIINDEQKFKRESNGIGKILSVQFNEYIDFQLWPNQLVVASKRDAIHHPFLEGLAKWAAGMRAYAFSTRLGQDTAFFVNDMNNGFVDPRNMNSAAGLFFKGEQEYPQNFKENIINAMKKIGYELDNIEIVPIYSAVSAIQPAGTNGWILSVTEKNSKTPIMQGQISQGMFRALSLIIQVTYNLLKNLSTTILIDDIGEGLDFDRSSRLIKLLIKKIGKVKKNEKNNVQLIMSTNDRFVMNAVPFEYWQVIQRTGGECTVYNYQNSKKKFDAFEYTGLNNFDFLRTGFLNSKWKPV
jgi:hypothetical protein